MSRDLVQRMMPGSAIVDIAVDQGGCAETIRPTTHQDPIYVEEEVVHYAVTNMPGAVPRTSTIALTNVTLGYALAMANHGWKEAMANDAALRLGLNVYDGQLVCKPVANSFGMECSMIDF